MSAIEKKFERETTLRWDDHRDVVHVFTASPVIDRKIRRAGHVPSQQITRKGAWSGSFYEIPYKALRWGVRAHRAPKTAPRPPQNGGKVSLV